MQHSSSMIPPNPFDRRARPDPYPIYQFMRTVEPVHHSPVGFWILTRYADCKAVLEDKRWSHGADRILEPGRGELDPVDPTVRLLRASMMFSDPPDHARHRGPLEAVMKEAMQDIEPRATQVATDLVKLMREKEKGVDLIRDYAAPLPLVVLAAMLGIPRRIGGRSSGGAGSLLRASIQWSGPPGWSTPGRQLRPSSNTCWTESERAPKPPEECSRRLLPSPGKLTTWELIADLTAFFVIGLETTSNLIGNAMLALLRNPEQMTKLRQRPTLIKSGLEELVRFDGPLHLTARVADEDVEVGGTSVKAGEQAILLLGAANRDPARFKEPDRLDLARTVNPHLGFGAGVHACFAAPLARLLAASAINTLSAELDGLELAGEPIWNDAVTVRGLSHLPATFRR